MLRLHVMISIITLTQIYHDGLVIMINVTVNNGNFLKYTPIELEGEKYILSTIERVEHLGKYIFLQLSLRVQYYNKGFTLSI